MKLPYLDGLHFRLSRNGAGPVPEEPTEASVNRLLEQMAYHEGLGVCWLVPTWDTPTARYATAEILLRLEA